MVDDKRLIFVHKWLDRATEAEDEFDRFFSAWIALVAAVQRIRDSFGHLLEEDTDRHRVVDYFRAKRDVVLRAVGKHQEEMTWLARRQGTTHGNLIIDTGNPNLRKLFTKLSRHYVADQVMQQDEHVTAIAELLNKVRNNVFHGAKVYDDAEDLELLRRVNPVLLAVLQECEKNAA